MTVNTAIFATVVNYVVSLCVRLGIYGKNLHVGQGCFCKEFNLEAKDVIRHYDVTGKLCPKYYVENPMAWESFLLDTAEAFAELEASAE